MSVYQQSGLVFMSEYQCLSAVQKTALRAVGPLYPPALSPPAKAPNGVELGRLSHFFMTPS